MGFSGFFTGVANVAKIATGMSADVSSMTSNLGQINSNLKGADLSNSFVNIFTSTTRQILWTVVILGFMTIWASMGLTKLGMDTSYVVAPIVMLMISTIVAGFTIRYYQKKNNLGDMVISPTTNCSDLPAATTTTATQSGPN